MAQCVRPSLATRTAKEPSCRVAVLGRGLMAIVSGDKPSIRDLAMNVSYKHPHDVIGGSISRAVLCATPKLWGTPKIVKADNYDVRSRHPPTRLADDPKPPPPGASWSPIYL